MMISDDLLKKKVAPFGLAAARVVFVTLNLSSCTIAQSRIPREDSTSKSFLVQRIYKSKGFKVWILNAPSPPCNEREDDK